MRRYQTQLTRDAIRYAYWKIYERFKASFQRRVRVG